ncbi:rod shape-determining protein MreD [Spirochaetia bacterium]|nr:rod shape-determining protein MreD [Spirochaetia bacterium]GHV82043.1 rod shape-determining protein MreD [Spirochaetia bacterium]
MVKNVVWATVFALIAGILQSTLFSRLAILVSRVTIYYAVPDLALGILVYSAYVNGTMTGQLTGFFSGFFLDFLSAAPLGLNAFVRTLVGAAVGLMNGSFFLDSFLLPMTLCAGATLIKAALFFVLHLLFSGAIPTYSLFEPTLWVELLLNTLSAPFLFGLLKLFNNLLTGKRKS